LTYALLGIRRVALDEATAQRLLSDLMRTQKIRGGGSAITLAESGPAR
jgi:hypothetical protein